MKLDNSRIQNPGDSYTENWQSIPCEFSFCEYDETTVYPMFKPVLCREFLTDALMITWGVVRNFSVYGFHFKGKIPLEELSLIVYNTSSFFAQNVHNHFHEIEKELKLRPTNITSIDNNKHLVVGDKFWLSHTVLLSWYSGLLRLCNKEKLAAVENHPFGCIKTFMKIPLVMSKIKPEKNFLCIDRYNLHTTHESNGFRAALNCTNLLPKLWSGLQEN